MEGDQILNWASSSLDVVKQQQRAIQPKYVKVGIELILLSTEESLPSKIAKLEKIEDQVRAIRAEAEAEKNRTEPRIT